MSTKYVTFRIEVRVPVNSSPNDSFDIMRAREKLLDLAPSLPRLANVQSIETVPYFSTMV